jgi:hypothetical protein
VHTDIIKNSSNINSGAEYRSYILDQISKGITARDAANSILKGVAANRETIVFPGKMKPSVFVANTFRGLFRVLMNKMLNDFRKKYREE